MALNLSSLLRGFVLLAVFNGIVLADIDISQFNANDLHQLPVEIAHANLTMEDAKALVRDKCIQVAGEDRGTEAYKQIEGGTTDLVDCLTGIVNFTAIQVEIDKASPDGELDVVFHKYCKRRPEAVKCVETFNSKLVPCLEKDEQENQEIFMRIVRSLLDFICHKGGDQIALFIAEQGPQCLDSKKDDIQQCLNNTFSPYIPQEGIENIKKLPKLVMGDQQCRDIQSLEVCIIAKLEKCTNITPANIVESMFRFVKNETICRNTKSNAASSLRGLNTALFTLATALFYTLSKWLVA